MAVTIDNEQEKATVVESSNAPGANAPLLGFAAMASMLSDNMGVTGEIAEFAEAIGEFITTTSLPAKVVVVKKDTNGIFYTNIVITLQKGKKVYYQTFLIAKSGIKQLPATEVIEYLKGIRNDMLVLPSHSIEENLLTTIEAEMKNRKLYSADTEFIHADGMRIMTDDLNQKFAVDMALYSLRYLIAVSSARSGEYSDSSLHEALVNFDRVSIDIQSKTGSASMLGDVKYVNFAVTANGVNKSNIQYNRGNTQLPLGTVYGNVRMLLGKQEGYINNLNQPVPDKIMCAPHIIINAVDLPTPTVGSVLFGIYQATLVATQDRWIKILMDGMRDENGNAIPGRDPGVFEKYVNSLGQDKPQAISLVKEKDDAKVHHFIKNMSSAPIIAMEETLYGYSSSEIALFGIAADHEHPSREMARDLIIKTAVQLTGGRFPEDFPTNRIFSTPRVVLPSGNFVSRKGEVTSLDEVDAMYIATVDKDTSLMREYVNIESSTGQFTNKADFLAKLETKFKRKFYIDGKTFRYTFSAEFISALFQGMNATGIKVELSEANMPTSNEEFIPLSQYGTGLSPDILNTTIGFNNQNNGFDHYGLEPNGSMYGSQYGF